MEAHVRRDLDVALPAITIDGRLHGSEKPVGTDRQEFDGVGFALSRKLLNFLKRLHFLQVPKTMVALNLNLENPPAGFLQVREEATIAALRS